MNYTPINCWKVLKGLKTQTRRLYHPGERAIFDDGQIVMVLDARGRKKWAVGETLAAAPGRGRFSCGRTRIAEVRLQRTNDITEADAMAEGAEQIWSARLENGVFVNGPSYRAGFFHLWDSINKRRDIRSSSNPEVWALTYEPDPEVYQDRFAELEREIKDGLNALIETEIAAT